MIIRQEPWLTESANAFLQSYFDSSKNSLTVLEFGMGASTLWFLRQKNLGELVSVEHDEHYYSEIKKSANEIENNPCFTAYYRDVPYHEITRSFAKDVFDIILVDGRNRVKCIQNSIENLKSDGILILDNSEREYYKTGIDLMSDWDKIETHQPEPDKYGFTYPGWKTTIFFKP